MALGTGQTRGRHRMAGAGALTSALVRLWKERRAVALIEFAIVMPILVILLLPLADLGMAFYVKTQVMTAAEAGAEFAFLHSTSWTTTTVQSAVTGATSLSVSATPAPSLKCGYISGTTVTYLSGSWTQSTCVASSSCGSVACGAYVQVNAQSTYSALFTYLIFGGSSTLSATSIVRVQ
jgi:Flp pilus assembly protein TadG